MNTVGNTGLAAERQERIRATLQERGIVRVDELSRELGVSAATIRRDLSELDVRGQVRRVHGGAMAVGGRLDEPVLFDDKAAIAAQEKQAIAEAAVKYISPSDSVFLDGGSTVLTLARLLSEMHGLTVVTNSLRVASTLSHAGPRVIALGGELRRRSQTFVGSLTQPVMDQLRVDIAFMGTIGLTVAEGLSTTDTREAFTKAQVMRHAGRVVLLADSSKIGTVSFVKFGKLEDVDAVVTDADVSRRDAAAIRKAGVDVVLTKTTGR